jgi:predicted nucleic acid-binding protein
LILVDTGPLVALFDPADDSHQQCRATLEGIDAAICTTVPVLTEAFHLLSPASPGAASLMEFVTRGGLIVWPLDDGALGRSFELIHQYADQQMDLADASLVAIAEQQRIDRVFTIDRRDFAVYRIRRGHRHRSFQIIGR